MLTFKFKLVIFLILQLIGVFAFFRVMTRSRVRILCYHGGCIGDENAYNPNLFCSRELLEKRMQWLRKKGFHFTSLDAALEHAHKPDAPVHLPVVITLDDGWHSTSKQLIPVLSNMNIPSTLYLCTEHFVQQWPVPAVAVRYIVWKSTLKHVEVRNLSPSVDGHYVLSDNEERRLLINRVEEWVVGVSNDPQRGGERAVRDCLEQFATCLQISASELNLESRRFQYMSEHELLALPKQGCRVELHGHVHQYPTGDPNKMRADVATCQQTITALGLTKPKHYCYPSGESDAGAVEVLKSLEVISATTCEAGLVSPAPRIQAYFLPRFLDSENVSHLQFEAEMSGFSGFARSCLQRLRRVRLAIF